THISDAEVLMLGRASATVCACPTTERDLGDGILRAADMLGAGVDIAIGSDSQTVIDPLEEIRLLEYHERLRRGRRLVLAATTDTGTEEVAGVLLECATATGARALGLPAGRIAEGALADFVAIDLGHRTLAGWDDTCLAALITLSAPTEIVTDVWINGVRQVQDGRHALEEEAARDFDKVARGIFR
ncbi:MAG TPA: amidohydrolase family protein, partial [Thermoanaerobaculia bacterium]|nr:amidohydrolase family protein [Thermoanaerobaculia bacterium]